MRIFMSDAAALKYPPSAFGIPVQHISEADVVVIDGRLIDENLETELALYNEALTIRKPVLLLHATSTLTEQLADQSVKSAFVLIHRDTRDAIVVEPLVNYQVSVSEGTRTEEEDDTTASPDEPAADELSEKVERKRIRSIDLSGDFPSVKKKVEERLRPRLNGTPPARAFSAMTVAADPSPIAASDAGVVPGPAMMAAQAMSAASASANTSETSRKPYIVSDTVGIRRITMPITWENSNRRQLIEINVDFTVEIVATNSPPGKFVVFNSFGAGFNIDKLSYNDSDERGFYLHDARIWIVPRGTARGFKLFGSQPKNANNSSTLQYTEGFTIGGDIGVSKSPGLGISGSYSQSSSRTLSLSDFSMTHKASHEEGLEWRFYMSSAEGHPYRIPSDLINSAGKIYKLPNLAKAGFSPEVQAVWMVDENWTGYIDFDFYLEMDLRFVNTYASGLSWDKEIQDDLLEVSHRHRVHFDKVAVPEVSDDLGEITDLATSIERLRADLQAKDAELRQLMDGRHMENAQGDAIRGWQIAELEGIVADETDALEAKDAELEAKDTEFERRLDQHDTYFVALNQNWIRQFNLNTVRSQRDIELQSLIDVIIENDVYTAELFEKFENETNHSINQLMATIAQQEDDIASTNQLLAESVSRIQELEYMVKYLSERLHKLYLQVNPPLPPLIATHTVKTGESLSVIALKYYKSAARDKWMAIYDRNRETIGENPRLLTVGMELGIPELE